MTDVLIMSRAGFARGATYLVRPDGYVAVAEPGTGAVLAFLEDLRSDTRAAQPSASAGIEPALARGS